MRTRFGPVQIDPYRIGGTWFFWPAGIPLMGLAAACSAFASYEAVDDIDRQSARPDVAALIYPVNALAAPYMTIHRPGGHHRGRHQTDEATREWSVESHVSKDCPPVFPHAGGYDDRIWSANSCIMQQACEKADVMSNFTNHFCGHGFWHGQARNLTQVELPGW